MVQLYYYENRGRCARKLLRHDGYSGGTPGSSKTRVLLFPYEGWAQPAAATYWLIKTVWWSRSRCKIVEVNLTQRIRPDRVLAYSPVCYTDPARGM